MHINLADDISVDVLVPATAEAECGYADLDRVRRLDDRLYGWHNTLSTLRH